MSKSMHDFRDGQKQRVIDESRKRGVKRAQEKESERRTCHLTVKGQIAAIRQLKEPNNGN